MSTPTVSVIIPTLNERKGLPETLAALQAHGGYTQCIVVDGGSDDGTPELAAKLGDQRLLVIDSGRGRGVQLDTAAQRATGDILLFLHADTLLPMRAIAGVQQAVAGGAKWGGFRHRFSDSTPGLRCISWLHNVRCRISGVVYGDQAMFCTKQLYRSLGGFPHTGLEDLAFSDMALQHHPSTLLAEHVTTDSRKFKQLGTLRAFCHVISIILRYERTKPLRNAAFFQDYR